MQPVVQLLLKGGDVDLSEEEIVDGDRVVTVAADRVSEEADIVAVTRNTAVMRDIVLYYLGNKKICYVLTSTPYVTISTLTWPWTRRASLSPTSFNSTITLPASGTMPGVVGACLLPFSRPAALYFWNRRK